ncbi:hypothetical protein SAMN04488523_11120 [Sulfitobacter brevis]|uniref:Uncharacterized protein n=1 Tax=Sulfitobacter brevis TaxID=74348 RepID=A0A1I2DVE2_9RHOB|nr:hypothetical protein [Sulfitobacter brevis]SFE84506.1 hypothetical protein SAMN04488523_11120 [Sulfitobacter brevis]
MKAFLLALVAAVVITIGMNLLLNNIGYTERSRISTDNVRLH